MMRAPKALSSASGAGSAAFLSSARPPSASHALPSSLKPWTWKEGSLFSFTIVRIPPAGWPGEVPYILGQVELPSGPQVLAEVIDCEHSALTIGMPVEMAIQAVPAQEGGEDKLVYKWRPASA